MLTPLEIQKKVFRRVFRGYCEEEVDSFLDKINQDYEILYRETQELKEKLVQSDRSMDRYRDIEEVLKNTMVMAQKNADELRQNTEKETRLIMDRARIEADELAREAEQEAAAIINEAEQRASVMVSEAEKKVSLILEEYHRFKREAQVFRMRLRSFLDAQVKLLDCEDYGPLVENDYEEEEPLSEPA